MACALCEFGCCKTAKMRVIKFTMILVYHIYEICRAMNIQGISYKKNSLETYETVFFTVLESYNTLEM